MARLSGRYANKRLQFRGAGGRFCQPESTIGACNECRHLTIKGIVDPAEPHINPTEFNKFRCLNPECSQLDAQGAAWAEQTAKAQKEAEEAQSRAFWSSLLGKES